MKQSEKYEISCIIMILIASIILVWNILPVVEIALPISMFLCIMFLVLTIKECIK